MLILSNIFVILLVLLIGYWWANQGLFSAILHFVCVLLAGCVAFAVWEPMTIYVLGIEGMDWYHPSAWGINFLLVFVVVLFGSRMLLDRLIPGNLDLPQWANLTFGGALGIGSGVLTIGVLIIGIGFIQSHKYIAGYAGYGRSERTGDIVKYEQSLWVPVHYYAYEFFSRLSVGSLSTARPLRQYQPSLHIQSALVRDSYEEGVGQLHLSPDAAEVIGAALVENGRRICQVTVDFDAPARDFGRQLTLSRSQVRLIGQASGSAEASVAYPDRWRGPTGNHEFINDPTAYVTSVPGQSEARITFEFSVQPNMMPKFIQIRNTRFRLPQLQSGAGQGDLLAGAGSSSQQDATVDSSAPSIAGQIEVNNNTRPLVAGVNRMPGGIEHEDRYLTSGKGEFPRSPGMRPSRNLRIRGFYEVSGTRIVKVTVSRNNPADFYDYRDQVEDGAPLYLVDNQGSTYFPLGYMLVGDDSITVELRPGRYVSTIDQMPLLPRTGDQELILVFSVTEGRTITGFKFGDLTVGTCNVEVEAEL